MLTKLNHSDYVAVKQFFESASGRKFKAALEETELSELHFAESAYAKYERPSEQVMASVNRARGVRMVLDYADACVAAAKTPQKRKEGE